MRKTIIIPPLSKPDIKRFWQQVDKRSINQCWDWKSPTKRLSPIFYVKHHDYQAARIAYLLYNPDFDQTLGLKHSCENSLCVNPSHLYPHHIYHSIESKSKNILGYKPMPEISEIDRKRFWSKVIIGSKNRCWPFTMNHDKDGYGHIKIKRRPYIAHRLAYFLSTGDDPVGFYVCHSCDNPPCCNPNHLFKGTHRDNTDDLVNKERQHKGEKNGNSKLTTTQVREIRKLIKSTSQKEVANIYGIATNHVWRITSKRNWNHI